MKTSIAAHDHHSWKSFLSHRGVGSIIPIKLPERAGKGENDLLSCGAGECLSVKRVLADPASELETYSIDEASLRCPTPNIALEVHGRELSFRQARATGWGRFKMITTALRTPPT
jgi:hypothetical protein